MRVRPREFKDRLAAHITFPVLSNPHLLSRVCVMGYRAPTSFTWCDHFFRPVTGSRDLVEQRHFLVVDASYLILILPSLTDSFYAFCSGLFFALLCRTRAEDFGELLRWTLTNFGTLWNSQGEKRGSVLSVRGSSRDTLNASVAHLQEKYLM